MLTGLLKPTAGEVLIGGFDMQREPEKAKELLAYVPDFPFLYDKLTAAEFMQFVGDIFRLDRSDITAQQRTSCSRNFTSTNTGTS